MNKYEGLESFVSLSGSVDERVFEATGYSGKSALEEAIQSREKSKINARILADSLCNQGCRDCFFTERGNVPYRVSDTEVEKIKELVDRLKVFDPRPAIYPKEITLAQAFLPMFRELGIDRALSNGVLLEDPLLVAKLKSFGIRRMAISLHGNRYQHTFITGAPESYYDRTLRGINNVLAEGIDLNIFTTVYRGNVHSLMSLFEQVSALGIKQISLIKIIPVGKGEGLPDEYLLTNEDIKETLFIVNQARLRLPQLKISLFSTSFGPNFHSKGVYRYLAGGRGEASSPYLCPWIDQHSVNVSLKTNDVYPCFQSISYPELKIGHITDTEINLVPPLVTRDILTKKLRGACSQEKCSYQSLCLGGCRISAYSSAKRKSEADPLYAGNDQCVTPLITSMVRSGEIKVSSEVKKRT